MQIDLTEWRFVKRDVMRFKDIGDWNDETKEIIAWSGLDEITMLEVWAHELEEMILCKMAGVEDKHLLAYDKAHTFAMGISQKIVKAAGKDIIEHEKRLIDYVEQVKYEGEDEAR